MCIGLVGRKHSVLKTVLACLNLRGNLCVLLHGMGCVSRVAWNGKQVLWLWLTVVLRTALYRQYLAKFELPVKPGGSMDVMLADAS